MMFLTLLPRLIDEALSLTVVITKRLYAIYTRSFESYIKAGSLKIITMVDLRELRYSFSDFDFQTQLLYLSVSLFGHQQLFLRFSSKAKFKTICFFEAVLCQYFKTVQ